MPTRLIHSLFLSALLCVSAQAAGPATAPAPAAPPAPGISAEQWKLMQEQQKKLEEARKEEKRQSRPGFTILHQADSAAPAAAPAQPRPAAPPAPPAPPDNTGEGAVQDAMRANEKMQQAYGQLNTTNPVSTDFDPTLAATGPAAQLQKLLSNPMVKGYMSVLQNPSIQKTLLEVVNHPNRNLMIYAQIGWILFMIVLRAWRGMKAKGVIAKVWLSLWSFVLYVAGTSIVVPWVVIGDPYYRAMSQIAGQFLAGK